MSDHRNNVFLPSRRKFLKAQVQYFSTSLDSRHPATTFLNVTTPHLKKLIYYNVSIIVMLMITQLLIDSLFIIIYYIHPTATAAKRIHIMHTSCRARLRSGCSRNACSCHSPSWSDPAQHLLKQRHAGR